MEKIYKEILALMGKIIIDSMDEKDNIIIDLVGLQGSPK